MKTRNSKLTERRGVRLIRFCYKMCRDHLAVNVPQDAVD